MAHFALVRNELVEQVIVVDNEHLLDGRGVEQEGLGQAFLVSIGLDPGPGGEWVQTSYTGAFRGRFAGVGMRWSGGQFGAADQEGGPGE